MIQAHFKGEERQNTKEGFEQETKRKISNRSTGIKTETSG
jgi:hypothetical protein